MDKDDIELLRSTFQQHKYKDFWSAMQTLYTLGMTQVDDRWDFHVHKMPPPQNTTSNTYFFALVWKNSIVIATAMQKNALEWVVSGMAYLEGNQIVTLTAHS